MTKNWAISIGINSYYHFAPLRYAKRDAGLMCDFFKHEAEFDEVCFFADDSPTLELTNGARVPTYPSFGNLRSFLRDRFELPFLSPGDNCWFFFAGHGLQHANRDYLMPIDANPRDVEATGIPVNFVRERLSRCGADNVILVLDACRLIGSRHGQGFGVEKQQGIITISACSRSETSWEIEELQQGAFTYALLEALKIGGDRNCATVERLSQYLRYRVPDICRQYSKLEQTPQVSVDPAEKLYFILTPQSATLNDVAVLREKAFQAAYINNNLSLAEQLCIRVIAAARGRDTLSLELFAQIKQLQANSQDGQDQRDREQPFLARPPQILESNEGQASSADRKDPEPASIYPPNTDKDRGRAGTQLPELLERLKAYLPRRFAIFGFFAVLVLVSIQALLPANLFSPSDSSPTPGNRNVPPPPTGSRPPDSNDTSSPGWGSNDSSADSSSWTSSGWGNNSSTNSAPPPPPPSASKNARSWGTASFERLETLLEEQKWEEADQETLKQLVAIVGQQEEGWLDSASVQQLPCDALRYVDGLWYRSSNGHFGFGVQAQIYRSFGGEPVDSVDVDNKFDDEAYDRFMEHVGWKKKDGAVIFPNVATFDISAPQGHLPAYSYRLNEVFRGRSLNEGYVLLRYLVNCGA